jgi:hypothetical protein
LIINLLIIIKKKQYDTLRSTLKKNGVSSFGRENISREKLEFSPGPSSYDIKENQIFKKSPKVVIPKSKRDLSPS